MSRNRLIASLILTAVMVIVIGFIVGFEALNATSTITVYQLTQSVTAGQAYQSNDVVAVNVHGSPGQFNYFQYDPAHAPGYVFKFAMQKGDIVQADDVTPPSQQLVQVAIQIKQSPNLTPGSLVNIYALSAGSTAATSASGSPIPILIGHNVTVLTSGGGGGTVTIAVPPKDETLWLEISTDSSVQLYATVTNGGSVPPQANAGGSSAAITQLNGETQTSGGST
ncbi:MAG: hypothetical protein ACP5OR_06485 [Candidatus Dormibacteria bacterium]